MGEWSSGGQAERNGGKGLGEHLNRCIYQKILKPKRWRSNCFGLIILLWQKIKHCKAMYLILSQILKKIDYKHWSAIIRDASSWSRWEQIIIARHYAENISINDVFIKPLFSELRYTAEEEAKGLKSKRRWRTPWRQVPPYQPEQSAYEPTDGAACTGMPGPHQLCV